MMQREVGAAAPFARRSGVPAGFASSREQFESLVSFLDGTDAAGLSHAELEERLDRDGRELLRRLLDDHLALRAVREPRLEQVVGDEGVSRGRVETGHARALETVFGTVSVERLAYRAPGVGNLHPADAALNLPVERHSHGLRKLAALEAPRGSFDDAVEAIVRADRAAAGQTPGRRARRARRDGLRGLLRGPTPGAIKARGSVGALGRRQGDRDAPRRAAHPRPRQAPRGPEAQAPAVGRRSAKPQADGGDRRRLRRHPGAAHGGRHPRIGGPEGYEPAPGPVATNKWLCASVVTNPAAVIKRVFDEAERRDPKHRRTWVALVDGANHQIERIKLRGPQTRGQGHDHRRLRARPAIPVERGRLPVPRQRPGRRAVGTPPGDHGCSKDTPARSPARSAAKPPTLAWTPHSRKPADEAANYLTNKAPYLDYPTALTNGWPIATGIVEGACRHLVKDRMDITGARWGLAGAEAILKLRAIKANGDFDDLLALPPRPRTTPRPRSPLPQPRHPSPMTVTPGPFRRAAPPISGRVAGGIAAPGSHGIPA